MPCTVHKKKGEIAEFEGYSRDEEERLHEFAQDELCNLLYHKRHARFFSKEMQLLADPEFDDPPTPVPRRRSSKKKSVATKPPLAAAAAPPSPRLQNGAPGEKPVVASSPFPARRKAVPSPSPPSRSNNLADFAEFWVEDEEDEA